MYLVMHATNSCAKMPDMVVNQSKAIVDKSFVALLQSENLHFRVVQIANANAKILLVPADRKSRMASDRQYGNR